MAMRTVKRSTALLIQKFQKRKSEVHIISYKGNMSSVAEQRVSRAMLVYTDVPTGYLSVHVYFLIVNAWCWKFMLRYIRGIKPSFIKNILRCYSIWLEMMSREELFTRFFTRKGTGWVNSDVSSTEVSQPVVLIGVIFISHLPGSWHDRLQKQAALCSQPCCRMSQLLMWTIGWCLLCICLTESQRTRQITSFGQDFFFNWIYPLY